mgnify:FL=1
MKDTLTQYMIQVIYCGKMMSIYENRYKIRFFQKERAYEEIHTRVTGNTATRDRSCKKTILRKY